MNEFLLSLTYLAVSVLCTILLRNKIIQVSAIDQPAMSAIKVKDLAYTPQKALRMVRINAFLVGLVNAISMIGLMMIANQGDYKVEPVDYYGRALHFIIAMLLLFVKPNIFRLAASIFLLISAVVNLSMTCYEIISHGLMVLPLLVVPIPLLILGIYAVRAAVFLNKYGEVKTI